MVPALLEELQLLEPEVLIRHPSMQDYWGPVVVKVVLPVWPPRLMEHLLDSVCLGSILLVGVGAVVVALMELPVLVDRQELFS
jgi:hypothetical protein